MGMKLLALSEDALRDALPMGEAVSAMKEAFASLSSGAASAPLRGIVTVEPVDGRTLVMGAHVPDVGLAAKVVSFFPKNREAGHPAIHGLVVVLDRMSGKPVALCDGTYLTALRTGAGSGAATDLLARRDARVGAVIGCGAQARTQVLAIDCVRALDEIRVFAPRAERVERFVDALEGQVKADLRAATSAAAAVDQADVVCAATSSRRPVFDGEHLRPGCHVNGIGSFTPEMQEIDLTTVRRARVFVDSVESALAEAGDLVIARERGVTRSEDWVEIGDVVTGSASGRRDDREITFFKSVGQAVQDAAAASRAVDRARARGLGAEILV
jgi:ornithine cyclodeaminase